MTDLEILRDYISTRSDTSFAKLVSRHIHWVHAAAVRQVHDPALAEDVTQAVFIALAQKGHKLSERDDLRSWLFRAMRHAASTALRTERRRKNHEKIAAAMEGKSSITSNQKDRDQIVAVLDELVARLKREDRELVLLRFYQQLSFREVAEAMGTSPEAAQKRAERALSRLRDMFSRRGYHIASAEVLGAIIISSSSPVRSALVAATTANAAAAVHGGATASAPFVIAHAVARAMTSIKASTAVASMVLGLVVVAATSTALVVHYRTSVSGAPSVRHVATKAPGVVYELNLDRPVGKQWSRRHLSLTGDQKHKFLGPFSEGPVTLSVDGLPAHQFIHVKFRLITYEPWNGDSRSWGRDLWDMRVVGGQALIHTTFSDCGFFSDNNEQSFPDQFPWYPTHPAWTGAASHESMGFKSHWHDEKGKTLIDDSSYDFDITFPHTADTLKLQFRSQIKQHQNKPYGFLSFEVETVDHAAAADETTLAGWWSDLAGTDAVKAYHAVWSMVATGDTAAKYIKAQMPIPADTYGIPMTVDLHQVWPYGCFTCDTPEERQRARAIHVLEAIGSPTAKEMLHEIGYAGTPQGSPPTPFDLPR